MHGGVYVPMNREIRPNPYLDVDKRDVVTLDGDSLTLINPAYMTRQVAELANDRNNFSFHVTSLEPLRPANAPVDWEAEALTSFKSGQSEYYDCCIDKQTNRHNFRYMEPLWTEKACLKCHAKQGYKEGDIRGGISFTLPSSTFLTSRKAHQSLLFSIYSLIWIAGILGTGIAYRMVAKTLDRKETLIHELRHTLQELKTLKGLIPICASCKKVRDDVGYWQQIETYISNRSEAEFSHAICPDCIKKLYPEDADKEESDKAKE